MNALIRTILRIFSARIRLFEWAKRRQNWLVALTLGPFVVGIGLYAYDSKMNLWWLYLPWIVAFVMVILLLLFTPVLAMLAFLIGVSSTMIAIAPFGLRLALASMWIELCVEAFPSGRSNGLVLGPSAQSAAAGLRHSFCYQEEAAIHAIVEYIKGKPKTRKR
jgi:hypothetical protein